MKYNKDCKPSRILRKFGVYLYDIIALPQEVFNGVNEAICSLSYQLKKCINNRNKRKQREKEYGINNLKKILKNFEKINRSHINDNNSMSRQLSGFVKNVINLFNFVSNKLDTCSITYFIKYCKRYQNLFHEIANPYYDMLFCKNYNKLIRDKYFDPNHQMYLMVQRIATHLSFSQVDSVNKMV